MAIPYRCTVCQGLLVEDQRQPPEKRVFCSDCLLPYCELCGRNHKGANNPKEPSSGLNDRGPRTSPVPYRDGDWPSTGQLDFINDLFDTVGICSGGLVSLEASLPAELAATGSAGTMASRPQIRLRHQRHLPDRGQLVGVEHSKQDYAAMVRSSSARPGSFPRSRFPRHPGATQWSHQPRDERSNSIGARQVGHGSARRALSIRL